MQMEEEKRKEMIKENVYKDKIFFFFFFEKQDKIYSAYSNSVFGWGIRGSLLNIWKERGWKVVYFTV